MTGGAVIEVEFVDLPGMAEFRSLAERDQLEAHQADRARRFRRRRVASVVSMTPTLKGCGRKLIAADARYKGEWTHAGPRAGVSGVWRCGKLHLCADCAGKGREKRATRVTNSARPWLELGGHLAFGTFTIGRRRGEPLTDATEALARVNARFVRLMRDSGWYEQAGIIGNIESHEWTIDGSLDGSGHPHLMRLYFFTNRRTLGDWHWNLARLWVKAAKECGRHATFDHGIRIEHPSLSDGGSVEVLSDYMTKGAASWGAGRELTRSDIKLSRDPGQSLSPFELLDVLAGTGEGADAWREYERASKGKATARFSRGLESTVAAAVASDRMLDGTLIDVETDEHDVDSSGVAAQVAEEEASVSEDELGGNTYFVLDAAAQQFAHDAGLTPALLDLVENEMVLERDHGEVNDLLGIVIEIFRRCGADELIVSGVMNELQADLRVWSHYERGSE